MLQRYLVTFKFKIRNESKEDGGEDTRGRGVSVGIILENENENVNETIMGDDNTQQQEDEEVQEQTIRQPTIFNVTAPPGTRAGQVIRVSTPRGIVQVAIPQYYGRYDISDGR